MYTSINGKEQIKIKKSTIYNKKNLENFMLNCVKDIQIFLNLTFFNFIIIIILYYLLYYYFMHIITSII
jgi:hypothetical protein